MNKNGYTQKYLRKRKMLLVMPVLFIPFITMAFWTMGGGKTKNYSSIPSKGLNFNLPNPNIKEDRSADKLSFYDQAERDSLKLLELMRNDPYYKLSGSGLASQFDEIKQISEKSANKNNQRLNTSLYDKQTTNAEDKLIQRLSELQAEIDNPGKHNTESAESNIGKPVGMTDESLAKLESLMGAMSRTNAPDQEMARLDKTLDKILDIQHPERIRNAASTEAFKRDSQALSTISRPRSANISLLSNTPDSNSAIGFYGENTSANNISAGNSIAAVIHENQWLVNGSIIKLRLVDNITVDGVLIPAGCFVFGIAQLSDERMNTEISSIRYKHNLFKVSLKLFDIDGLAGIHIPGAISRDVIKQSADNSLQLFELSAMDPSFKAQAATAGINTIKNLLGKKVKQTKVFVKAGYRILLMDTKFHQ